MFELNREAPRLPLQKYFCSDEITSMVNKCSDIIICDDADSRLVKEFRSFRTKVFKLREAAKSLEHKRVLYARNESA